MHVVKSCQNQMTTLSILNYKIDLFDLLTMADGRQTLAVRCGPNMGSSAFSFIRLSLHCMLYKICMRVCIEIRCFDGESLVPKCRFCKELFKNDILCCLSLNQITSSLYKRITKITDLMNVYKSDIGSFL